VIHLAISVHQQVHPETTLLNIGLPMGNFGDIFIAVMDD